jgi:hypothetical protein
MNNPKNWLYTNRKQAKNPDARNQRTTVKNGSVVTYTVQSPRFWLANLRNKQDSNSAS